jgi:hypothetical protein
MPPVHSLSLVQDSSIFDPIGIENGCRIYRNLSDHKFSSAEKLWLLDKINGAANGIFDGIPMDVSFTGYGVAMRHSLKYNTVKAWMLRYRRGQLILDSSTGCGRPCLLDCLAVTNAKLNVAEAGGPNKFNPWQSSRCIRDYANETRHKRGAKQNMKKPIRCVQTIRKYKRMIFI